MASPSSWRESSCGSMPTADRLRPNWLYQLFIDALDVPLIGANVFAGELVEDAAEDAADVVFEDELALLHAFKQLAAQAVDGFALLVHDVVVLEQMFARLEVLRLDGFLRALDALGDHLGLDGHALFHAQALQQGGDPLLGEDAHEVVFEREVEARLAGIALAAGAAAELVVDAPRLVALGAEDEEAAGLDDLLVLLLRGLGVDLEGFGPLGLGDFELLALVVEAQEAGGGHGVDGALGHADGARAALLDQFLAGHELGVAAEQNVGAAAGHVGGDGDHAEAAGLGHDFGFALVELGVQHDVADAFAREDAGEPLASSRWTWCRPARAAASRAASAMSSAAALYFSFSVR